MSPNLGKTQLIQDLQTVFLPTASVQAQASNTQIELTTLPIEQQVVLRALATQQGTLTPLHIARQYAPKTFKILIQKTFKHYCQQLSSNQNRSMCAANQTTILSSLSHLLVATHSTACHNG